MRLKPTPFIPARHPEVSRAGALKLDATGLQIGIPDREVRRLLGLENLPEIASVEPIAVGYGAHFGMGLFVPAAS
jgi:hypothetical protein